MLSDEAKVTFDKVVGSLKQRLLPVRSKALLSALLIKRKQHTSETVDEYAQEFEALYDKSYGRRAGMDEESKQLLKRVAGESLAILSSNICRCSIQGSDCGRAGQADVSLNSLSLSQR